MAEYLTKEKVEEIFQEHGGDAKNTGSVEGQIALFTCLLYTSPSPRDATLSRMPSSA